MAEQLQIGFVLFPRVTQLDFTGPLQVVSRIPNVKVHLIWKRIEPVPSDTALTLNPTTTFADCPQLDVICVPGGIGTDDMVNDADLLSFLRRQAERAKFITSVCTGSLVLGAAGLLDGYRATTHWGAMDHLAPFGATPVETRGVRRPQPHHRRRRYRRDRFRADDRLDAGRSPHGRNDPADAGVRPRPAVQRRVAEDCVCGGAGRREDADGTVDGAA